MKNPLRYMRYIALLLLLLPTVAATAQIEEGTEDLNYESELSTETDAAEVAADIYAITKRKGNDLYLRWAPTTKELWRTGIENGYILEKVSYDQQTEETTYTPVAAAPIKPWPLEQWRFIVSDDRPYAAAAAMCIYGDADDSTDKGFVQQYNDENNRFGFHLLSADLDHEAAVASGLGYVIQDIDTTDFYVFRLRLADAGDTGYDLSTTFVGVMSEDTFAAPSIDTIFEAQNTLTLQWDLTLYSSIPTAYHIERSTGGQFTRLTTQPYVDMNTNLTRGNKHRVVYKDSVAQNYTPYSYRLIAIDAFGDESIPSTAVTGVARDNTPPNSPLQFTSEEVDGDMIALNWLWDDYDDHDDLAGFKVVKSQLEDGIYEPLHDGLLPADTRKILDNSPNAIATNFYKVIAVDEEGNESESSIAFTITIDKVPPQAPTGLIAEIDTTGRLVLTWDAPDDADLRGYLVHYSHSEGSSFAVVPGDHLPFTHYVDSLDLRTLTEDIYYYVVAVDYSYNPSEPSEILKVKKPDLVPPAPSIFTDYKVSAEGIYFEWMRSPSDDVVEVLLERKSTDSPWKTVVDFDQSVSSYTDTDVTGGVLYQYRLTTTDDDGNTTMPDEGLSLEALTPFYLPPVTDLLVTESESGISLSWEYSATHLVNRYVVYRKRDGSSMKTLSSQQKNKTYTDSRLSKKSAYQYGVIAIGHDGRESKLVLSEVVKY